MTLQKMYHLLHVSLPPLDLCELLLLRNDFVLNPLIRGTRKNLLLH
jgi:hypothetical protein